MDGATACTVIATAMINHSILYRLQVMLFLSYHNGGRSMAAARKMTPPRTSNCEASIREGNYWICVTRSVVTSI